MSGSRVAVPLPPPKPFLKCLRYHLKETFFPDDPFQQFKNQPPFRRLVLAVQYFFPILEWLPRYSLQLFKADFVAGITIASLGIPQGISYAKLANLPPIIGLYSSFVPPLIYAMMGSSRDLAVGTVAVGSLLIASMLGRQVNANDNSDLYVHLVLTTTFFAGVLQASLGVFRLGFIVDLLSHATIVGFMAGAATVVCLQQLKGILGLDHFTHATDIVSVMRSVFSQTHQWRWQSALLGCCFLFFLIATRYFSKRKPNLFWISAMAPLTSIILGSLLVYFTHAEEHGVQVIGKLKKGINPLSFGDLVFVSPYVATTIKAGIIVGIIALAEGIAVGRSFAMFKNYHIDGNKEMIAFGVMNIVGSFTSCYLTTGPFSRTAVNFNAGCKTAVSNIVMATTVMIALLFLIPLFHYTPLVILSSIIISAMLGLVDYEAAIRLWKVDKLDFAVCLSAFLGVVFASIEVGLVTAVAISVLRLFVYIARPWVAVVGNVPDSQSYRNIEQYPNANRSSGILILELNAPVYFINAGYLRERITRWIKEEEERLKLSKEGSRSLQFVILHIGGVGNIDTSGISMLEDVHKDLCRKGLKVLLANPGPEVMKKLDRAKILDVFGSRWIHSSVAEAVRACNLEFELDLLRFHVDKPCLSPAQPLV